MTLQTEDSVVSARRPRTPPISFGSERRSLSQSLRSLLFSKAVLDRRKRSDRRASERLQTQLVCEECMDGARHYRLSYDLSTFGMSTQYGPQHGLGTRLELVLHLPDDERDPVRVNAEVVGLNE